MKKNTEKTAHPVIKTQAKSTNQHKTNKNIHFYSFFLIRKVYHKKKGTQKKKKQPIYHSLSALEKAHCLSNKTTS